jgi:hypothetical protein
MRFPWVHLLGVEFLLSGKHNPFHSPDKNSYLYQTGSSYATACTTGLAGALFCCDRIVDGTYGLHDKEKIANAFRGLYEPLAKLVNVVNHLVRCFSINLDDLTI